MLAFSNEGKYWSGGLVVSGGDEVGMGAFAGPVVAAVVSFTPLEFVSSRTFESPSGQPGARNNIIINDSKKLSEKRRVLADEWIRENASYVGIGEGSVEEINRLGIRGALGMAFRRAIKNHNCDLLMVDGGEIPSLAVRQEAIVKGDSKVFSIAAASIVAKVYRDSLMVELSREYGKYGWERNKGYGTKAHRECIVRHGVCSLHRKQYVESYLSKLT